MGPTIGSGERTSEDVSATSSILGSPARAESNPQGGRSLLCASEPKRAAQLLVDQRDATRYDYALQALSEIRYDVWRDYSPEDTLRFYALRLHEASRRDGRSLR